jgi:hypothetical protein
MFLKLIRKYYKPDYTIGHLYIDGNFYCDTLEDCYRKLPEEKKVIGNTAIPFGEYRVTMSFSERFKKVMPEILNVPYFEGIRIHAGNTNEDTSGCILVGRNTVKGALTESRKYSDHLNGMLLDASEKEKIFINLS